MARPSQPQAEPANDSTQIEPPQQKDLGSPSTVQPPAEPPAEDVPHGRIEAVPSEPSFDQVLDRFRSFLTGKKLRFTREREELLAAIFHAPRHFEAEDLIRTVHERNARVSRATIYRTLSLLEECGILQKSLFGHNRHFYESLVGRHHHDHIVCIRCGQIQEFDDERIEAVQKEVCARLGFALVDHMHEIFGICGTCQSRAEENARPLEEAGHTES